MVPRTRATESSALRLTPTEAGPSGPLDPTRPTIEPEISNEDTFEEIEPGGAATPLRSENEEEDISTHGEQLRRLLAERDDLAAQVKIIRVQSDIEYLKEEKAGNQPKQFFPIPDTTLPTRKRQRSDSPYAQDREELQRMLKISKPKTFSGASMKDLRGYDGSWQNIFEAIPQDIKPDWAYRIHIAANYLADRALNDWRRDRKLLEPVPLTWALYLTWCKNTIEDADVRKGEALETLATLKQGDKSVRDLVHRIELLEDDVGPLTEDERKGWALFHALSPALRRAVRQDLRTITSRAQVLAAAVRLETIVAREKQPSATSRATPKQDKLESSSSTPSRRRLAFRSQEKIESSFPAPSKKTKFTEERVERPIFDGDCWNCGKKGHKGRDCRSPPNPDKPELFAGGTPARSTGKGKGKEKGKSKN
jgi:hypothetical protein